MTDWLQSAKPRQSRLIGTLACNFTCRANPLAVGVKPQADQQLRCCVVAASVAFNGRDPGMIQTQIHAPYQVPDRAGTVVLIDQSLDVKGVQKQLRTVDRS